MAEFKLGRIRFVWKGEWASTTTYYVDDVVRYGGKTYICVVGHTAAASFDTDLDNVPSRWNQMTDGQAWKGDWSVSTSYKINDIVKYGGQVYICNESHTSAATETLGLEQDQSKWDLFAESFEWKTSWTVNTRYKINDIVKYGGYTYLCNTAHTSAATETLGLEQDQSKWDVFNAGFEYKGDWSNPTRYKVNDVVKFGSGLWICVTAHTSTSTFSLSNFEEFVNGFSFENDYNAVAAYKPGDVVRYGGNQYIAKTQSTGATPSTSTTEWALFTEGFNWQSDWSISTSYKIGDVIRQNGYSFIAVADAPSNSYTVTASTSTDPYNFTTSSTTGMVANMAIRFTGTLFGSVNLSGTYYVKEVLSATEFTISLTPGGTVFVPTTASGTMTATVAPYPANVAYYSRLTSGFFWRGEWQDDTEYNLGDTVKFGSNAYICVQNHRSEGDDQSTLRTEGGGAANSRPDLDTPGVYWNALAVASEVEVLTTKGDLVYYSPSGPTRLPIGTEGQVLRASGDSIPEWATVGAVEYVYHVAPSGTNHPAPIHGKTRDRSWKSIRYACEQVENGPRNPNAKHLLEMNRVFIQKEVSSWIDYQITNEISPFVSSFDYDEYKCERDVGFVIDALIHDIGHGGNVKTRGAALALVGGITEDSPGAYITKEAEKEESLAAYAYLLTLVDSVLDQQAPTTAYQNVSDDSTAIVAQYFNSEYTAESTAITEITSLVSIITNAISDGDADNIPARYAPNNLILVATGRYRETLPIIVPEQTCVMGDELRSTNAGPSGSVVNLSDAKYSMGTLTRLENIIEDIVLGNDVTETSGNSETQDIAFPYATSNEGTDLKRLIRSIQHKVDYNLGTMLMASYPNPTNYNTSYLTGYGDARTLLKENKNFVKEEIIAFISSEYPSLKYSRTKCRRDVGFIVDALIYDLTYGGYTQTLNAGLAYFDGQSSLLMIDSTEITPTVAAYGRLKTVIQQIISNTTVSKTDGNLATQWTDSTNLTGGNAASSFVGSNIDIIVDIIQGDSTGSNPPTVTVTTIATNDTITTSSAHGLQTGDTFTPLETTNGLTAGTTYYVKSVPSGTQITIATSFDGTTISSLTNGTGLSIPAHVVDWPATSWVSGSLVTAWTTLSAAVSSIVSSTTSFISSNYPSLVYNSAKCERDVRIILNAVGYDFMFGSNYQSINAAYAYLRSSASDVYSLGQKAATRAAFGHAKDQAKANVGGDSTAQARIESLMTTIDDILFGATNEGSPCATGIRTADYAVLQIERNRTYLVSELNAYIAATYTDTVTNATGASDVFTISDTSWLQRNTAIRFSGTVFGGVSTGTTYYVQNVVSSTEFKISTTRDSNTALDIASNASGSMTVSLYYDQELCTRDINSYLDALKYDIKYPGNYKSLMAARLYSNSVTGSLEEDMFYLRDGTGLRDMTLEGLTGDLLPENEFGTSRVSAGANASLDPGWGPDDFRCWIINRSPYVQGLTTFGTAAIGQKIDGALHNGGNDSIVSNDFTQVISDGIGAWVANNGRAELVSVFTYYAHIGYLATGGGRIRGTNGNNSYGDFGSVAEGFDTTETANTAIVDNKFQFNPTVESIYTDGNEVLAFEFGNAGSNFTEATWLVTGAGLGASVEQDEFRDDAVYQVRLIDLVDDSTNAPEAEGNFGGFGYLSNANTAQSGTVSSVTLAATDDETSSAYIGMKIYITGGAGVGQFGIINAYNSGTKIAEVIKETNGASGFDHVIPGTTIVSPDASSTYIIEPRIEFTAPTFTSTARTLASRTWVDVTYGDIIHAYAAVSSTTSGTGTGATFNVLKKGNAYSVSVVSSGAGYERLDVLTILGTSVGGLSPANDITITATSVNSITGGVTRFDYEGTASGGNFVAIATGTSDLSVSTNSTSWTTVSSGLPASTTWTAVQAGAIRSATAAGSFVTGKSYTIVTLGSTDFTLVGAVRNAVGEIFTATGPGTGTGTARQNLSSVVAIASGGTTSAYSIDGGLTWDSGGALPASATWTAMAYGNGRWVAIASGGTSSAFSTDGGVTWTAGGALPSSTTWSGVAYGKGVWVAIATGGTIAASSVNGGVAWTLRSLPSSSNWSSVTYGNNRFVAVSSTSGTVAAYSLNGTTWTASTLPATAAWTSVRYGQGVFLAVSQSTQAASSEDGVHWTSRTMSTAAAGFSRAIFGNPNRTGIWAAVQRGSAGTVASSVLTGARARGRVLVEDQKISTIRIVEPGSGYSSTPSMTIIDPNNTFEAPFTVRTGKGALSNPSFLNRGNTYSQAGADLDSGDGFADFYQPGSFVAVRRVTQEPVAGSNVVFGHLPDRTFKLVNVVSRLGDQDGSYTAFFQISPVLTVSEAPEHGVSLITRIRYSQVRLTGHDFLDIGTGNFIETNYPGLPTQEPIPANETVENDGGRVFFTSTDQDGNFRVGGLFNIEQSTGIATLNADAFNISGLQELTLGSVALGGASATINEFSTDPFFTADSDTVVPTQRAIKAYIAAQIGGGGASLNVNSITAGSIKIDSNQITNVTGASIKLRSTMDFQGGVKGYPIVWNYFLV